MIKLFNVGDRVHTPDKDRIAVISSFLGTNEVSVTFEDNGKTKKFSIATLRKVKHDTST